MICDQYVCVSQHVPLSSFTTFYAVMAKSQLCHMEECFILATLLLITTSSNTNINLKDQKKAQMLNACGGIWAFYNGLVMHYAINFYQKFVKLFFLVQDFELNITWISLQQSHQPRVCDWQSKLLKVVLIWGTGCFLTSLEEKLQILCSTEERVEAAELRTMAKNIPALPLKHISLIICEAAGETDWSAQQWDTEAAGKSRCTGFGHLSVWRSLRRLRRSSRISKRKQVRESHRLHLVCHDK